MIILINILIIILIIISSLTFNYKNCKSGWCPHDGKCEENKMGCDD